MYDASRPRMPTPSHKPRWLVITHTIAAPQRSERDLYSRTVEGYILNHERRRSGTDLLLLEQVLVAVGQFLHSDHLKIHIMTFDLGMSHQALLLKLVSVPLQPLRVLRLCLYA